jgi:hypothetical protein
MQLENKNILIVSQQAWSDLLVSKHHYAIELSMRNNRVYFLNPPDQHQSMKPGQCALQNTAFPNLKVISHRLPFPFILKFHLRKVFNYGMKWHIHRLLKKVIGSLDVVWSFDLSDTIPLSCFPNNIFKIFMPVDMPYNEASIFAAAPANCIVVITHQNEVAYQKLNKPMLRITHGVDSIFLRNSISKKPVGEVIRIGMSGNFTHPAIDWPTLHQIIRENNNLEIHCWGAAIPEVDVKKHEFMEVQQRVYGFMNAKGVHYHGKLNSRKLAEAIREMDGFLICYQPVLDPGQGNYHKMLEFLGTGKVIISNFGETYHNTGLVEMSVSMDNEDLPSLFKRVIASIQDYNTPELQQKRIQYACQNTYACQVDRINQFLSNIE